MWEIRVKQFVRGLRSGYPRKAGLNNIDQGIRHPNGGAVALSFDGSPDNFYEAAQILVEYGAHATFFIQGDKVGAAGYLTASQLAEMEAMGHEIGSHSWTHGDMSQMTEPQLVGEFEQTLNMLISAGVKRPWGFAWPGGLYSELGEAVARRYHTYARRTPAVGTGPYSSVHSGNTHMFAPSGTHYVDNPSAIFQAEFESKLLAVRNRGFVIMPYMHNLKDNLGGGDLNTGKAILRAFCDHCRGIGLPIVPLFNVLQPYNLAAHVVDWNMSSMDYWTMTGQTDLYAVTIDNTQSFHATNGTSMKISPIAAEDLSSITVFPTSMRNIFVEPGQKLIISARVNIPVGLAGTREGRGVYLGVYGYRYGETSVASTVSVTPRMKNATTGWVALYGEYIVPSGVTSIRPYIIYSQATGGDVYIDMLEVIPADEERILLI